MKNIKNFIDFITESTHSLETEKEELKSVKRSFTNNDNKVGNLPNKTKYKFNHITRKMDDLSQDIIDDKVNAIETFQKNEEE
jgi:uncharacterized protein YaaR (DUF327 family)